MMLGFIVFRKPEQTKSRGYRQSGTSRCWAAIVPRAPVPPLLIEMRIRVAQRLGGDLEHAVEGRIHL